MSDDDAIITTGNPGLAKLAMYLLGVVVSLGLYVWQHEVSAREKLDGRMDSLTERVGTLELKVAVSENNTAGMRDDLKAIRDIVEKLRHR